MNITINQAAPGVYSGRVTFQDGKELELWTGGTNQLVAQLHAALTMANYSRTPTRQGTSFDTWGHAFLKKAANLQLPRYSIDNLLLLKPDDTVNRLYNRLKFFRQDQCLAEEILLLAATSFNYQMISGVSWFFDNGLFGWVLEARAALLQLKATPYLELLDDVIARLQRQLIDIHDESTYERWHSLPDKPERAIRRAFEIIESKWWGNWEKPEASFENFVVSYIRENIEIFRSRCAK